jgi:hypothetical protein
MKSQGRLLLFVIIVADVLIVLAVVALKLISSRGTTESTVQNTDTPKSSPGLMIYGTVLGTDGEGLDNIAIYRSYSSYPGVEIAVTDASGYYQTDFYSIPGDEMVSVWAESAGLQFTPASCSWRHYAGYEMRACDFSVLVISKMYLPLTSRAPK